MLTGASVIWMKKVD